MNEHSTSYFIGVNGVVTVSAEVAKINPRERMNLGRGVTPKFVDLGLSPTHTADKLNSIFAPATRAGGLADNSDWLASKHCLAEVIADRVSEAKAYSDYIKNS